MKCEGVLKFFLKNKMTHKDLEVWKMSMDLVEDIYKLMKQLPESENMD